MSKEAAYVPVSELSDLEHSRVIWRAALPDYAPAENILVNVDRLSRLASLGGMESLRITGYSGDTTQVTPEAGSVNQQGVATAVLKGSVSKAETHKANASAFEDAELPYEYQWTKGRIALNLSEIDERVARKSDLRDPKQWSKQLDRALRSGVRDSSWESLIAGSTNKTAGLYALAGVITGNVILDGLDPDKLVPDSAQSYVIYALLMHHGFYKLGGLRAGFSDRKHALMLGVPLDRYLALNATSRALPLVKAKR